MGRNIVLLVCLLLVSSVGAQTYTVDPALDSVRTYCYYQLQAPVAGTDRLTPAVMASFINRAYAAVCVDLPAIEKSTLLTITKNTNGAELPADYSRAKTVYRLVGDKRLAVRFLPSDSLIPLYGKETDRFNTHSKPEVMSPEFWYTFADSIMLQPKFSGRSSGTDSLALHYFASGTKLTSGTDSLRCLPEYVEAVIDYTCMLASKLREKTQDMALYKARYDEQVGRARKARLQEYKK